MSFENQLLEPLPQIEYSFLRFHLVSQLGEAADLRIRFYDAIYHEEFGSIFATQDILALIPNEEADVAILEEPEHLNWFRVPPDLTCTSEITQEEAEIGWTVKFKHVVGILHTNYGAYIKQKMGGSFVAISALNALSSIVVRAYCHRVIRLSAVLPEFDAQKEITCNVHGVRSEFFSQPHSERLVPPASNSSAIYFIGKLVWAKGFDKLLSVQEKYHTQFGTYFPIDVYGSGADKNSIRSAFLGRKGIARLDSASENEPPKQTQEDRAASLLFESEGSLRTQLNESRTRLSEDAKISPILQLANCPDPLGILGEISYKSANASLKATFAGKKLSEKLLDFAFNAVFSEDNGHAYFDPPKSRFELRRCPIPSRFLGVVDHAMLKHSSGCKIFLNMSETEVLCTTTAEALAMGKFVIIPVHRKYMLHTPRFLYPFLTIIALSIKSFQRLFSSISELFVVQL